MENLHFCVYIMTDKDHSLLYTGRTSNLKRRVAQHRSGNGGVYSRAGITLTGWCIMRRWKMIVQPDARKEDQTHFQTAKSEIDRRYEPRVEGFIFGNLRIKDNHKDHNGHKGYKIKVKIYCL